CGLSGCCIEQWTPGMLAVSGSTSEALGNVNGRIYSMNGSERISRTELKDISVLHILLFEPDIETRGGGSGIQMKCLRAMETLRWTLGNSKSGPFNLPDQTLT